MNGFLVIPTSFPCKRMMIDVQWRPNKKETRFISEISSLPLKI